MSWHEDLDKILQRSLWEDLVEIPMKALRGPCSVLDRGACMKALLGCLSKVLAGRSCKVL